MLSIALTLALACNGSTKPTGITTGDSGDTGDTGSTQDLSCPSIDHTPIETAQPINVAVPVTATIVDAGSGVFVVELYFKKEASTSYTRLTMTLDDPANGVYAAEVPASQVASGGMDYYIQAVDNQQNTCTDPYDGANHPYHFRIDGG